MELEMNVSKLSASQLEALRFMDLALGQVSEHIQQSVSSLRQVAFTLNRTWDHGPSEPTRARIRLKGSVLYTPPGMQGPILTPTDAVLELVEVSKLCWDLEFASILFTNQHFILRDVQVLRTVNAVRFSSTIEQTLPSTFPV